MVTRQLSEQFQQHAENAVISLIDGPLQTGVIATLGYFGLGSAGIVPLDPDSAIKAVAIATVGWHVGKAAIAAARTAFSSVAARNNGFRVGERNQPRQAPPRNRGIPPRVAANAGMPVPAYNR